MLTVKDKEGHWSNPSVKIVDTRKLVIPEIIGEIDGSRLKNGVYELQISAEDFSGNRVYLTCEYDGNGRLIRKIIKSEVTTFSYNNIGLIESVTDKNCKVTDTYSYDAFGNILEREGDTENSYLYVGEQFDVNTGFYYLRARYMNPLTGTFVSMDGYGGSVYDPVSLHKYLYANSNPVMYSDPTGYFSLSELSVSSTISSILDSMAVMNFKDILMFINTVGTVYDVVRTAISQIQSGESLAVVCGSISRGFLTGFLLNKMCAIKSINMILAPILVITGSIAQVDGIYQAIDNGDYDLAIVSTVQLAIQIFSLSQSCFTGETLVCTEEGEKRIDEIKEGE